MSTCSRFHHFPALKDATSKGTATVRVEGLGNEVKRKKPLPKKSERAEDYLVDPLNPL
jgi:hypothetical protein